MLSNPLASSSLPKREVWKCFKSSSHTTSQVFAWNHVKILRNSIPSVQQSFAKLCSSKRESVIASQKILRTEVHKVWRKWGFFMRFGLFFYSKRKARQDKMFILTLMLYCTSKSCKIQVAKVATKRKF